MTYSDRLEPDESQNQGKVPNAFTASKPRESRLNRKESRSSFFDRDCSYWKNKGECTYPNCKFIHDDKVRGKKTRKEEHCESDGKKKRNGHRNNRVSKENENKPASNTVMYDTVVPLPTGVFRQ